MSSTSTQQTQVQAKSLTARQQFLKDLAPYPVDCCSILDCTQCDICTEELTDDESLVSLVVDGQQEREHAVILHDTHVLGEKCIRSWLAENNSCPKCRTVLFEDDESEETDDEDDYQVQDHDNGSDHAVIARLQRDVTYYQLASVRGDMFPDATLARTHLRLYRQWRLSLHQREPNAFVPPNSFFVSEHVSIFHAFENMQDLRMWTFLRSPQRLENAARARAPVYDELAAQVHSLRHRRIRVDFDAGRRSPLRLEWLAGAPSIHGFGAELTELGHPLQWLVVKRLHEALRAIRHEHRRRRPRMTVLELQSRLRAAFESPGTEMAELRRHGANCARYVGYAITVACFYALREAGHRVRI